MRCLNSGKMSAARCLLDRQFAVPKKWLFLLVVAATASGCASHQIGPNRPVSIDGDLAFVSPLAYPNLNDFVTLSPRAQAEARNQIVTARMYVADMEYHTYESSLTREMQDEGLLATATSLGLTTSATLVGAAPTKTILSGVATGVTGLDKAYNEKELLSNAVQALQTQMRADRQRQAAVIYAKMFKDSGSNAKTPTPISEYTLPMALSDSEAYYQAGTVASALVGLSRTVANAETNADQAKSEAGPNPTAVGNVNRTAAPMAPTTARVVTIRSPTRPIPIVEQPSLPHDPNAVTQTELGLSPTQIEKWQKALCVEPADRSLGPIHSKTRTAIRDYLISKKAINDSDMSDSSFEVGERQKVLLNILAKHPMNCAPKEIK